MSKKYGIGFLIATILLIFLFVFAYRISYHRALENKMSEDKVIEESVKADAEICYYIMELDGYVTVFDSDKKTVYEYTSIEMDELPDDIRESVKKGIKFTSLGQVYGFLENYSS